MKKITGLKNVAAVLNVGLKRLNKIMLSNDFPGKIGEKKNRNGVVAPVYDFGDLVSFKNTHKNLFSKKSLETTRLRQHDDSESGGAFSLLLARAFLKSPPVSRLGVE